MRELVELSLAHLDTFLSSLPEQEAWNNANAEQAARSVMEPMPEQGQAVQTILRRFFDEVVPVALNTTSPGYLAYVPGGGLPQAAVADLIAGITNRFVTVWSAAPAIAQIETAVIRWFCEMVGYSTGSGGFLTSGGSLANLSAIVTARRRRADHDFQTATIYTSDQTHHSICKAAVLAGFPAENIRQIEVDQRWRVRVDCLGRQVARDRAAGFHPLIVVAQAGTTNTGAVDNLSALADLATAEELWLHADAAYGGFFMLTQRGQRALEGLARADSVTLDPHKGLFLPYGTGCLLVRNLDDLKKAHDMDGAYMPSLSDDPDFLDFSQLSPELSRDFRGLRVWLPLQLHGAGAFRQALDEKLDLAQFAARQLQAIDEKLHDTLEIMAEPQLSIVAFRLRRAGLDQDATNTLNKRLLAEINAPRRVYLTSTELNGNFAIRICVLSFRTHLDRMRECVELIGRVAEQILS
ncbi:MAG: pyridoxal-dependent decarboxylase [Pirellulaceae bacterium]|jgi:aromatic-L-amino-acid decarboxylase|nr:decarboxylase [Planctomycetaceae bacterium]MDP6467359.1 pyridoxal-dependent decarboxylase [Pirellulaceae bacterium]